MFTIAVVGSGPAGSSATSRLLKLNSVRRVNLIDRSPVPWGLLRTGVAPDHPEVKDTYRTWKSIGINDKFHFYGGLNVGPSADTFNSRFNENVPVETLINTHDAVLLANGAYSARRLNISAFSKRRVISGQEFVGLYNSDPYFRSHMSRLNNFEGNIGIIGGGNVALDIARIILTSKSELYYSTDISSTFHEKIGKIKEVNFFIRRGPFDLTCTTREMRELLTMPKVKLELVGLSGDLSSIPEFLELQKSKKLSDRKQKRLLKILATKEKENIDYDTILRFHFYQEVVELKERDEYLECEFKQASPTLNLQYLVVCMGYERSPISKDIIITDMENGKGTLHGKDIYLAGWALSGGRGVVADSTESSRRAVNRMIHDLSLRESCSPSRDEGFDFVTSWSDWLAIDEEEKIRGQKHNRIREKFETFEEMVQFKK